MARKVNFGYESHLIYDPLVSGIDLANSAQNTRRISRSSSSPAPRAATPVPGSDDESTGLEFPTTGDYFDEQSSHSVDRNRSFANYLDESGSSAGESVNTELPPPTMSPGIASPSPVPARITSEETPADFARSAEPIKETPLFHQRNIVLEENTVTLFKSDHNDVGTDHLAKNLQERWSDEPEPTFEPRKSRRTSHDEMSEWLSSELSDEAADKVSDLGTPPAVSSRFGLRRTKDSIALRQQQALMASSSDTFFRMSTDGSLGKTPSPMSSNVLAENTRIVRRDGGRPARKSYLSIDKKKRKNRRISKGSELASPAASLTVSQISHVSPTASIMSMSSSPSPARSRQVIRRTRAERTRRLQELGCAPASSSSSPETDSQPRNSSPSDRYPARSFSPEKNMRSSTIGDTYPYTRESLAETESSKYGTRQSRSSMGGERTMSMEKPGESLLGMDDTLGDGHDVSIMSPLGRGAFLEESTVRRDLKTSGASSDFLRVKSSGASSDFLGESACDRRTDDNTRSQMSLSDNRSPITDDLHSYGKIMVDSPIFSEPRNPRQYDRKSMINGFDFDSDIFMKPRRLSMHAGADAITDSSDGTMEIPASPPRMKSPTLHTALTSNTKGVSTFHRSGEDSDEDVGMSIPGQQTPNNAPSFTADLSPDFISPFTSKFEPGANFDVKGDIKSTGARASIPPLPQLPTPAEASRPLFSPPRSLGSPHSSGSWASSPKIFAHDSQDVPMCPHAEPVPQWLVSPSRTEENARIPERIKGRTWNQKQDVEVEENEEMREKWIHRQEAASACVDDLRQVAPHSPVSSAENSLHSFDADDDPIAIDSPGGLSDGSYSPRKSFHLPASRSMVLGELDSVFHNASDAQRRKARRASPRAMSIHDSDSDGGKKEPSYRNEQGYRNGEASYRNDEPSYRNDQGDRNEQEGYRNGNQSYRNDQPSYRNDQPSFRNDQPSFRNDQPSYRSDQPSYRNDQPSYRNDQPSYRSDQPGYRNDREMQPNNQENRPSIADNDFELFLDKCGVRQLPVEPARPFPPLAAPFPPGIAQRALLHWEATRQKIILDNIKRLPSTKCSSSSSGHMQVFENAMARNQTAILKEQVQTVAENSRIRACRELRDCIRRTERFVDSSATNFLATTALQKEKLAKRIRDVRRLQSRAAGLVKERALLDSNRTENMTLQAERAVQEQLASEQESRKIALEKEECAKIERDAEEAHAQRCVLELEGEQLEAQLTELRSRVQRAKKRLRGKQFLLSLSPWQPIEDHFEMNGHKLIPIPSTSGDWEWRFEPRATQRLPKLAKRAFGQALAYAQKHGGVNPMTFAAHVSNVQNFWFDIYDTMDAWLPDGIYVSFRDDDDYLRLEFQVSRKPMWTKDGYVIVENTKEIGTLFELQWPVESWAVRPMRTQWFHKAEITVVIPPCDSGLQRLLERKCQTLEYTGWDMQSLCADIGAVAKDYLDTVIYGV